MTARARAIEVLAWRPPAPGSTIRDRDVPDWREAALCAQADAEAFFPEKGAKNARVKRICGRCPVREQCLNWAMENHPIEGIWGGLSKRERQRLVPTALLADDAQTGERMVA